MAIIAFPRPQHEQPAQLLAVNRAAFVIHAAIHQARPDEFD